MPDDLPVKRFSRCVEDFTCDHCGRLVSGTGFNNHCPSCLWSKHVDINPGDRRAACRGMMRPYGVDQKGGEWLIVHRCQTCGFERRNQAAREDSFEAILELSTGRG
jgi:hypothetical protein